MSSRAYDLSWLPLHVADWRASDTVRVLSLAGKGAYLELLMSQWRAEQDGLPPDPAELKRLAGWKGKGWHDVWTLLAPHFPVGEDARRRNPRIESEREKIRARRVQQSTAGSSPKAKNPRVGGEPIPELEGKASRVRGESDGVSPLVPSQTRIIRSSSDERMINNPNPNPNTTSSDEEVGASSSSPDGMADRFEHPAHRLAYLQFRTAHRFPLAFDSTLGMMLEGAGGARGRAATIWQLGSALADAAGNGTEFNANLFRGFLGKAPRAKAALALIGHNDPPGTIRDGSGVVIRRGTA